MTGAVYWLMRHQSKYARHKPKVLDIVSVQFEVVGNCHAADKRVGYLQSLTQAKLKQQIHRFFRSQIIDVEDIIVLQLLDHLLQLFFVTHA